MHKNFKSRTVLKFKLIFPFWFWKLFTSFRLQRNTSNDSFIFESKFELWLILLIFKLIKNVNNYWINFHHSRLKFCFHDSLHIASTKKRKIKTFFLSNIRRATGKKTQNFIQLLLRSFWIVQCFSRSINFVE
jgi:hypothetical protein